MCGISGVVNCGDREALGRMNAVQGHRGPDGAGVWDRHAPDGSYVGLGNRRLAVLDLSDAGRMPMSNEDGSVWITYNGEIYNYAALRHELQQKGHRFRSETDTEVIVHLYEEDGPQCLTKLQGMFAFAICDLRSGSPVLFLARDHFGIKPLYYWQRNQRLAFASEVKGLLELPEIEPRLDLESLHQYLTFLWVPDPQTMFRDIFKLPAGHYATFRNREFRIHQYWDLTFPPAGEKYPHTERELTANVQERFRAAVRSQMISDVPLGAFLSAGLDSSGIVAMMAEASPRPVRTYTVTFPEKSRIGENTLDDPRVAARFAAQLGCEHQEMVLEPDVVGLLPKLVWHMDEPVADPAILPAYLVCREARRHSTVLLSGVGGDEVFGGYRKYAAHFWAQAYRTLPGFARRPFEKALQAAPSFRGTSFKGRVRLAKKMARSGSLPPAERFIADCTYFDSGRKAMLYESDILDEVRGWDPANRHRAAFEKVRHLDFLHQMLYLDTKIFMASLNLTYNDKMSMASSVEVRVPFLDRELVEFVAQNVPPWLKLKGFLRPATKHIFRKAMQTTLPQEVLRQPKAGFAVPVDHWLAHDLKEMVDDLLSDGEIRRRGLFRPGAVRQIVDEHRTGREDWSAQIWQFLTLELWMQKFLDGRKAAIPDFSGLGVASA